MSLDCSSGVDLYPRSCRLPQGMMRRLTLAFILLAGLGLVELIVSYQHHNLSLLADAGHVASDAGAIALTVLALWLGVSQQKQQTRFDAIVAVANSLSLLVIAINVIVAATGRLHAPTNLDSYSNTVLLTAIAGFVVNGCNALGLKSCSSHSLSLKSALLHVLADMVGALGVLAGFLSGKYLGLSNADAIASLITSTMIISACLPLMIQSGLSLVQNSVVAICSCHSQKRDLEEILFPSLERLVL